MRNDRQPAPATVFAVALGAAVAVAVAVLADYSGPIGPAQAQSDADKKTPEPERRKAAPPRPQPPPPPAKSPEFKAPPPSPPKATAPPPPPKVPPQRQPQAPERPAKSFQQPPPPAAKSPQAKPPAALEPKKEGVKRLPPPPVAAPTQKQPPPAAKKAAPPPQETPPVVKKAAPPAALPAAPGPALKRVEEVQKERRERIEEGGRRKVLSEPGKRFIVKERDRSIIRHDHAERFLRRPGAKSQRRPDGSVETYYMRPDGVRIVTVVDGHGRLLRRFRRHPDGREHSLIDNRRFYRRSGAFAIGIAVLALPPLIVTIPRERYIVDYGSASDDDLYEALEAPPIEDLERAYSLDEILDNNELRARMRRIDLDSITFEFGSWEVPPDQYDRLERIARAILRVLRDNPEAVFLLAGHTDAPGDADNNLSLSDRRAQSVAEILSETFDVPPENLVSQGYGEQYLKIDTEGPEPRNRRVSIINITRLMAER